MEQAKVTGQMEADARGGYAVLDEVWALLSEVGGTVTEARRRVVQR